MDAERKDYEKSADAISVAKEFHGHPAKSMLYTISILRAENAALKAKLAEAVDAAEVLYTYSVWDDEDDRKAITAAIKTTEGIRKDFLASGKQE